jgi:hypothetical protein
VRLQTYPMYHKTMKLSYLILVCCLCAQPALAANKCDGKLDAFVGVYEIIRNHYFDKEIGHCIPGVDSLIRLKQEHHVSYSLTGFVVGIEQFWHNKFSNIIKVTTKAGGNTTVVKLFSHDNSSFYEIPNAEFSSNMEYIVISKEGPEYLQVATKNSDFDKTSQFMVKTIFQLINGKFSQISAETIR